MIPADVDPFQVLCQSDWPLTKVSGLYFVDEGFPPMLVALELDFAGDRVLLTACEDDSLTVQANVQISPEPQHEVRILNNHPLWQNVLLVPLLWVWRMTNQQGYFDGLQLEFSHAADTLEQTLQILVLGSEFKIRRVPHLD